MSQTAKKREICEALERRDSINGVLQAFDMVIHHLRCIKADTSALDLEYEMLERQYVENHQRALALAAELRTPKDSFSGLSLHPWRPRASISKEAP